MAQSNAQTPLGDISGDSTRAFARKMRILRTWYHLLQNECQNAFQTRILYWYGPERSRARKKGGIAHTASESDCGGTLRRSAVAACGLARARHRPCVYCPTAAALARLLSVGELSGKRCRLRACSRDRRCAYRHSHGSDVGSRPEVLATPPLAPQASIFGTANECVYVKALASATDDTWRSFGRGPRPNDRERPAGQAPIDLPVKPQS